MRTITLLTAIVLVALQAKAEPVLPTDEKVLDQEGTDAGDQVMAISFAGAETSALQDPGERIQHGRLNVEWSLFVLIPVFIVQSSLCTLGCPKILECRSKMFCNPHDKNHGT
uniref:Alpha-defensin N-terminal domain-containing protein n=1 Tax=Oryctolagus cuniculus TaxID=9986 RepID=A0A5F9DJQ2_RABIT